MQWSQLRASLHSWVISKFRVDAWQLDNPTVKPTIVGFGLPVVNYTLPPNRAIKHPLTDVRFESNSLGDRIVAGILYDIQYRFPKSLQYHQLPIVDLEVLLLNRLWELTIDSGCVIDGARVTVDGIDQPLIVEPTESNTDWLVTIKLYLKVDAEFEPENIPTTLQLPGLADDVVSDPITQIDYTGRDKVTEAVKYQGSVQLDSSN